MITKEEAQRITINSISEEKAKELLESLDAVIRAAASRGESKLAIERENFNDAEANFIRAKAREAGFQVSEMGLVIYW